MNISGHGDTKLATNFPEQFATVTDIRSPKGTDGSAICLIVGSFKDKLHTKALANGFELARDSPDEGCAFDDAGPEDKEKLLPTESIATDGDDWARHCGNLDTTSRLARLCNGLRRRRQRRAAFSAEGPSGFSCLKRRLKVHCAG
jgi:hypothetical protein